MHTDATLLARYTAGSDLAVGIRAAAVALMVVLTIAAAQVSVPLPFTPVPFTLQPMVVLLGGAVLGARLGMIGQLLYLAAGAAGLAVFAASPVLPQGAARFIGPTGGYLMAYPLAAFVTGRLAECGWDRRYVTAFLAMAAGLGVIFAGGVLWLAYVAAPAPLGFSGALMAGLVPFLAADAVKLLIAAAVLPTFWRFVGHPRQRM
jgi:biotin transport system substrate-specific component